MLHPQPSARNGAKSIPQGKDAESGTSHIATFLFGKLVEVEGCSDIHNELGGSYVWKWIPRI